MDVAFGDFTLTEREALFEDVSHSIEFIWQDGMDEKVYDNDKTSTRSRKLAKQRAVPVGTTGAVQFSEKCLRQEGGGINVDGEIIFQAPLPGTDGSSSIDVCVGESSEGDLLDEVQARGSPLNEEASSFLNVAAPEFVPELAPTEMKDGEEEEENVVSSNSDVSSSQSAHPHKHRHFNKHQAYQPYPMIPDYSMLRGPIPSHLPLPYPYYIPRHPRDPLIPLGMPFGYPYPPMQLQQSRMFPEGFPGRHPQVYTAGVPSEIYMMEFGAPFSQDIQGRLYPWTGVPEQAGQSPESEHEVQDSPDGMPENSSPTANTGDTTESRAQDNITILEGDGDQFPMTNLSENTPQFSTKIESNDLQYDDTGDSNIDNDKAGFSEEIHPIKDNSTGQVVDTGYIQKNVSNSQSDETPSTVTSKAFPEHDDLAQDNLELNSEKAEVIELSQDSSPADNTVQQNEEYCTVTATVEICDVAKLPEDAQNVRTELAITEITEPQPTITPVCVGNDVKVVPEEKPVSTSPPVVAKKLSSTGLGNKLNEPKIKPPPVAQQHKVDKRTSNNNNSLRTSNQFSSNRENSYSRMDSQTFAASGKISSKGSTKSGPNIILRAQNAPEKKSYQSYYIEPAGPYTTGSKDTNYFSSSSATSAAASEVKKSHSNSSTHSVSKEASNSSSIPNSSNATVQCNTQVEVKKPQAWGQTKKWSQLFNNNSSSSKETAVSASKDPVVQADQISSGLSEPVINQTPPNPEHVNKQLKSLGEQLKTITVDHKASRPFLPRGLVNRGNMCYVHTILQVLLSCPSVYNLFSSLNQFPMLSKEPSATPLTDCMIQFTNEFSTTEADFEANQKASRKKKSGRDLTKGSPFQPDYVYSVLHKMHSSLTVRGKQEDAEEFLGTILDGLHEEMIEAKEAVKTSESDADSNSAGEVLSSISSDETNEWEEVGHKNKSTITRVVSSSAESHITEIFGGKMRSAVHSQGAKESATVQPFFTLPLDIQASDVMSVEEALSRLAVKEPLLGYTCSKTQTEDIITMIIRLMSSNALLALAEDLQMVQQMVFGQSEVEAFKRVTLSKLPSVLILHFKRFLFNQTGGSQKLSKEISYPLELEIPKELLAPTLIKGKNKTYRLTGTGGHYTCDVYHPSCGGWLRLDDSSIKPVTDEQVIKHHKERTAYLLFYQKSDISCNK